MQSKTDGGGSSAPAPPDILRDRGFRMAYKYLNRSAVLEHLQEGQTVNIDEYIEKLRFFKKYTDSQGTYITDRRYI